MTCFPEVVGFSFYTESTRRNLFGSSESSFETADSRSEYRVEGAGQPGVTTDLLGTSLKDHILLALVQPPLPHGPVMQYPVLPLEELVQDI